MMRKLREENEQLVGVAQALRPKKYAYTVIGKRKRKRKRDEEVP